MSANKIRWIDQSHVNGSTVAFKCTILAFTFDPRPFNDAIRRTESGKAEKENGANREIACRRRIFSLRFSAQTHTHTERTENVHSLSFFVRAIFNDTKSTIWTSEWERERLAMARSLPLYCSLEREPLPIYQCIGGTSRKIHLSVLFCGRFFSGFNSSALALGARNGLSQINFVSVELH